MKSAEGSGVRIFLTRAWRIIRWPLLVLLIAYVAAVIWNIPWPVSKEKTDAAVAAIHAQRLTMADVDGKHLPPAPDPAQVNATVEGVDANSNGIRDDVELAIFKKYPNSQKIRAAELQYALTEQMFITSVFNRETWKAVAETDDRAYQCNTSLYSLPNSPKPGFYTSEIENLLRNTKSRQDKFQEILSKYQGSFGLPDGPVCDINLNNL